MAIQSTILCIKAFTFVMFFAIISGDMQRYNASLKLVGLLVVMAAIGFLIFAVTSNSF